MVISELYGRGLQAPGVMAGLYGGGLQAPGVVAGLYGGGYRHHSQDSDLLSISIVECWTPISFKIL